MLNLIYRNNGLSLILSCSLFVCVLLHRYTMETSPHHHQRHRHLRQRQRHSQAYAAVQRQQHQRNYHTLVQTINRCTNILCICWGDCHWTQTAQCNPHNQLSNNNNSSRSSSSTNYYQYTGPQWRHPNSDDLVECTIMPLVKCWQIL